MKNMLKIVALSIGGFVLFCSVQVDNFFFFNPDLFFILSSFVALGICILKSKAFGFLDHSV